MVRKASLGVEPYEGKVLEDQNGPIDATRKNDPWANPIPALSPDAWVQFWVGRAMRFQDSMRHHHLVDSTQYVQRGAVLRRWLLNAESGLFTKAECDVVLDALQRSPGDPVDPAETPAVMAERDGVLGLARARVMTRKAQLT